MISHYSTVYAFWLGMHFAHSHTSLSQNMDANTHINTINTHHTHTHITTERLTSAKPQPDASSFSCKAAIDMWGIILKSQPANAPSCYPPKLHSRVQTARLALCIRDLEEWQINLRMNEQLWCTMWNKQRFFRNTYDALNNLLDIHRWNPSVMSILQQEKLQRLDNFLNPRGRNTWHDFDTTWLEWMSLATTTMALY